jgi:hypothetical protein
MEGDAFEYAQNYINSGVQKNSIIDIYVSRAIRNSAATIDNIITAYDKYQNLSTKEKKRFTKLSQLSFMFGDKVFD